MTNTGNTTTHEAHVQVVNARFEVVTKRLTARTQAALAAKLDKLEEAGTLVQVLAFSA